MEIKKAKYVRELICEIEDYNNFMEEINNSTDSTEYSTIHLEVNKDGRYFPVDIRLHTYSVIAIVSELLKSKKEELRRIK